MKTTVGEIVELIGGELVKGSPGFPLTGFAALEDATATQISFCVSDKFSDSLKRTKAAAVIVPSGAELPVPDQVFLVKVDDPALAFDTIVAEFGEKPPEFVAGFGKGSFVDETAKVDESKVSVLPGAVVLKEASIGNGTRIQSGAVIGERVSIGADCDIGPNVTIREGCVLGDRVIIHGNSVVGADGFGYEFEEGRHRKVDQLGIVRIEDDVEIGASTTIDRARFGETVIGEGTKIDNQVQIAHNVVIGKHCVIVSQTGIAGSSKLGNYVTVAAQCGIAGHIEIADRVTLGGRCGVISSITEPGGTYFGYPAKPLKDARRTEMRVKQLGRLLARVKDLEKKMEALDEGE